MNDPRKGLPSASNAEADFLCPGRFAAQKGLEESVSDDATSGNRVHLAFQLGNTTGLSDFEAATFDIGAAIEDAKKLEWLDAIQVIDPSVNMFTPTCYRELRMFHNDADTLQPTNSGQADAVWIAGRFALMEDIKSLFGDVPSATSNYQLRDLAVLLFENFDVTHVTAYINQPRITTKPSVVVYTIDDLKLAQAEMVKRVKRSMSPNQPRRPGLTQCKFCRAIATCPESVNSTLSLEQPNFRWDAVTSENKLKLYDACKTAQKFIDSVEYKIKEDLKFNGDAIPGLALKPGRDRRELVDGKSINDVFGAIAFDDCPSCSNNELTKASCTQCSGVGRVQSIASSDFVAACGVKISETETLFRKAKGLKTKDATVEFNRRLEGVIEKKKNQPSVERL